MPELVRLEGLTAKVESSYKTDATPTAGANGVQVEETLHDNLSWGFMEENLRENLAGYGLGRAGTAKPSGRFMEMELTVALKGKGSAYAASGDLEFDPLLRACGLSPTVDTSGGSEKITYTPVSSSFESATIYAYSAEKLYKVLGCRGNVRFVMTPGQIPRAVFSMSGVLDDVSQTTLPQITYATNAVQPPVVAAAGLTLNSVDPAGFDDFELDMQVDVVPLPRGNDADGHAGYYIADWNPQIDTTIERAALSSFNPWNLRENGTLFAWDLGAFGPAQYNQIKLSGPKGRVVDHSGSSSDGIASGQLTIRCQNTDEETQNDAVSLEFS